MECPLRALSERMNARMRRSNYEGQKKWLIDEPFFYSLNSSMY